MDGKERYTRAHNAARRALGDSAMVLAEFAEKGYHYVTQAAGLILKAFEVGGKVLACGNGGSAAQASHLVGELVGRFQATGRRALPAIALSADPAILTAVGNDWSFADIFSRQVEAWIIKTDVLVALSTSGNSPNVVKAVATARTAGARTIALTAEGGGALADLADCWIAAPTKVTAEAQECHLAAIHTICGLVDANV